MSSTLLTFDLIVNLLNAKVVEKEFPELLKFKPEENKSDCPKCKKRRALYSPGLVNDVAAVILSMTKEKQQKLLSVLNTKQLTTFNSVLISRN